MTQSTGPGATAWYMLAAMAPSTQSETPPDGRLAENILYFARTLRAAGLPVGPGKVLDALQATATVGLSRREDFYWTLHAIFVNRRDQQELFDQAFHMFWRNPKILERVMSLLLPDITPLAGHHPDNAEELSRRLTDVLRPKGSEDDALREEQEQTEIDAVMTFSSKEILQEIDFEKMSGAELAEAKRAIQAMRLPIMEVPTRRFRPAQQGQRADLRATMRAGLRSGGDTIPLRWKRQRRRHPPLVVLCDISGSMSRYSRMLLHFMHAVTNDRDRVHSFVFGTRLTNITRHLRHKDVDVAVEKVSDTVVDWSGGTRIGACLHDFNRVWARRVLGQGAVLLLISDGLDRDNAEGLAGEIERLHKSCRRLIWLNPLLRYDAYEPKSMGAKAMIGHVDDFRTIHNLESLSELSTVLSRPAMRREEGLTSWQSKKR
ncbi:vWA domain-containing protein [Pelagibius litoralis]|nr:VWA domain-containing protein [Pelagibius litoralis]